MRRLAGCRICRDYPLGRPLPHEPRPVLQAGAGARIMIAGQAPGTRVHASGRPFTDPSGDRLRQWLQVDSDEFYDPSAFAIVPMGLCFPGLDARGSDLPPRRECAPAWRRQILDSLPQIELVICLGSHAMAWHMGNLYEGSVDATVRNWRQGLGLSPKVFPLPHPSWRNTGWLKSNPWFEAELLPELRRNIRELRATQLADRARPV
jgi:uracil-DNA glycosylase